MNLPKLLRVQLLMVPLLMSLNAGVARADLVLSIEGIPGSGQTTWEFSGTGLTQAGTGNTFVFSDLGNFTTLPSTFLMPISGSATVVHEPTGNSAAIFGARVIDQGTGQVDDLSLAFSPELPRVDGDEMSWSGALVFGFDINDLDEAGLPFSVTSPGSFAPNIQLSISVTAIPEASSWVAFSLLTLGCAGWAGVRRIRHRGSLPSV